MRRSVGPRRPRIRRRDDVHRVVRRAPGDRRAAGGPPLSPAILAGRSSTCPGMLGNTPADAGDVAAQTRETLAKIGRTLAAAGATPADVVDGLVYLTDAAASPR